MSSLNILRDADVADKRVLVRVDFNVPLTDDGAIADDTRLQAVLPTLRYLIEAKAKVILLSHFGRPTAGDFDGAYRLDPLAPALSDLLDHPVAKLSECVGNDVEAFVKKMKAGDVVLLENTRFYDGEKKNDESFAKQLAALGELYVNDAFGAAHRAHASTVGVATHLPAYAGLLMESEIEALTPLLEGADKPLVMIVGGAKIDTKIGILNNFIGKADTFLVGGGLANTFLFAAGYDVAESLYQPEKREVAQEIMLKLEQEHECLLLPKDVVVASEIGDDVPTLNMPIQDVELDMKILDIGKFTIKSYLRRIADAEVIVWNGPMGLYEKQPFAAGTEAIAKAVAKAKGKTILGGGDTIDAIKRFGHSASDFTHVSTGGGAMLKFLEGKPLPAVEVLMS